MNLLLIVLATSLLGLAHVSQSVHGASLPPEIQLPTGLVISQATRTVDVTSQIVKVKTDYQLRNEGKEELAFFVHTLTEAEAQRLSWMLATEAAGKEGKEKEGAKLRISKVALTGAPNGFVFHKVELLSLLGPGQTQALQVDYALTEFLVPHPKEIAQGENQLVLYNGHGNVPAAYAIATESVTVKTGKTKPVSFTEVSPTKWTTGQLSYGPYEKSAPYTKKPITVHFENNSPFLVAERVERIIEISHWGGNIAVEEHIDVVHKGAALKGSFSRLDYQVDRRGPLQPSVKSFKTNLPGDAQDIYYRDEIGNISTSNVAARQSRLEVELRPRFPLFGGWHTNYVLGYNVPTAGYLFSSGSNHALKFRLLGHLWENQVVEKLRVKIILPELSRNFKLVYPYAVRRLPDEVHKTFLDTSGRPVIVLEKENLVNSHIQTFTLYYEFDRIALLREPLLVVAAFSLIFFAAVLLFRLDFSIHKASENGVAAATDKNLGGGGVGEAAQKPPGGGVRQR